MTFRAGIAALLLLLLGLLQVRPIVAQETDVDPSEEQPPADVEDEGDVPSAGPGDGGGGGGPSEYSSTLGYENLNKHKLSSDVTAETTALLGEHIDLNTGSISFEQMDVLIPGNSALEVAIRRTFKGKSVFSWLDVHPFENWMLDIPYIHTNQVNSTSAPSTFSGPWGFGQECTRDMSSGIASWQGNLYTQDMWWTGDTLHVPGKTHEKLLMNFPGLIADAGYVKVTASNWRVSCIDRFEGGVKVGEGFVVESPDGLTYTFSKLKRVQTLWADILPRYDTYMLVTKVEDRFGNHVNYNYSGTKLVSIIANDGRTITLQYGNSAKPHRITSVTANGRVWNYGYSAAETLQTVTRPDGKSWSFGVNYMSLHNLPPTDRLCNALGSSTATLTVQHV